MNQNVQDILKTLETVLIERKGKSADTSYVATLYEKGNNAILKKIGEEATETILAVNSGDKKAIIHETADLWFHAMVMLVHNGLSVDDIALELQRRFGRSGLAEKAARDK